MSINVNLKNKVYSAADIKKKSDYVISELAGSNKVNSNIVEFFDKYEEIRDDIPVEGAAKTHEYLYNKSKEYLGRNNETVIPTSEYETLLDEKATLQQNYDDLKATSEAEKNELQKTLEATEQSLKQEAASFKKSLEPRNKMLHKFLGTNIIKDLGKLTEAGYTSIETFDVNGTSNENIRQMNARIDQINETLKPVADIYNSLINKKQTYINKLQASKADVVDNLIEDARDMHLLLPKLISNLKVAQTRLNQFWTAEQNAEMARWIEASTNFSKLNTAASVSAELDKYAKTVIDNIDDIIATVKGINDIGNIFINEKFQEFTTTSSDITKLNNRITEINSQVQQLFNKADAVVNSAVSYDEMVTDILNELNDTPGQYNGYNN